MLLSVLAVFALAMLAPPLSRALGRAAGWLFALLPAALFVLFLRQTPMLQAGRPWTQHTPWVGGIGVDLAFRLDGLAALMALLIVGIGAAVLIFSSGYLAGDRRIGRFYAWLLLFMGSMLGLVLADNLILLFVFWELTSFSSFLLIGFNHDQPDARRAALTALTVTAAGGLALLAGLVMLTQIAGASRFSELLAHGPAIRQHALYVPILVLVLLGAFTKSAQFPFHFWLPQAMAAPTPVSAYLHAATMVKAGIYLLARLNPILGTHRLWQYVLVAVGAATLLAASALTLRQHDAKRLLAYSTVSVLGALTMLLGLSRPAAAQAAVVFLAAHALYKGAMFLVAGSLDHATGTRKVNELGGLCRAMPLTCAAAVLAGASMAGLPPLFGFLGKEALLAAVAEAPAARFALIVGVLAASATIAAVALQIAVRPFFGVFRPTPHRPHRAPVSLWLGPVLLAAAGLVLGLLPELARPLIQPAVDAVHGGPAYVELKLWHGLNLPLGLSVAALAGGLTLHLLWDRIVAALGRLLWLRRIGPAAIYDAANAGLVGLGRLITGRLQSGLLRRYMLIVVASTVGLVGTMLLVKARGRLPALGEVRPHELAVAGVIVAAALAAARARTWMAAIASLGVVGFAMALLFILFAAPDLAMTQFLIETLSAILFVLIFYHLPELTHLADTSGKLLNATVAVLCGAVMAALVLLAIGVQLDPPISQYYLQNSVDRGFGRNVVNVILVDFRALDTMGEITVLGIAGMGVYSLLRLRLGGGRR